MLRIVYYISKVCSRRSGRIIAVDLKKLNNTRNLACKHIYYSLLLMNSGRAWKQGVSEQLTRKVHDHMAAACLKITWKHNSACTDTHRISLPSPTIAQHTPMQTDE
jgi:hypothetical protein